jgi:hypothetical protein
MDKLSIYFRADKTTFAPGQAVHGAIQWSLETNPRALELSLFWYTAGKGTRDVGVVETLAFDQPGSCGSKDFTFTLPKGPFSFSGRLISVIWALELTCSEGDETVREEIIVSPTGCEIVLGDDTWAEDRPRGNPLERILRRQP